MREEKNTEIAIGGKEEIGKINGEPTAEAVRFSPRVDIFETADAITLVADLPGVSQENLTVNVEDGQLAITGLVKEVAGSARPVHLEYGIGGYARNFRLGNAVDPSRITASLKYGVLTLSLPKSDHLKPRKIEVSAA